MRIKKIFKTIVAASALVYATHSQNVLAQAIDNALNAKKPNFVIILFDDMGFSELGAFGSEIPTPNLDQLAAQGITFTNFYASPTSTPSRIMFPNHALYGERCS